MMSTPGSTRDGVQPSRSSSMRHFRTMVAMVAAATIGCDATAPVAANTMSPGSMSLQAVAGDVVHLQDQRPATTSGESAVLGQADFSRSDLRFCHLRITAAGARRQGAQSR